MVKTELFFFVLEVCKKVKEAFWARETRIPNNKKNCPDPKESKQSYTNHHVYHIRKSQNTVCQKNHILSIPHIYTSLEE